jgi:hypothetical protein
MSACLLKCFLEPGFRLCQQTYCSTAQTLLRTHANSLPRVARSKPFSKLSGAVARDPRGLASARRNGWAASFRGANQGIFYSKEAILWLFFSVFSVQKAPVRTRSEESSAGQR